MNQGTMTARSLEQDEQISRLEIHILDDSGNIVRRDSIRDPREAYCDEWNRMKRGTTAVIPPAASSLKIELVDKATGEVVGEKDRVFEWLQTWVDGYNSLPGDTEARIVRHGVAVKGGE